MAEAAVKRTFEELNTYFSTSPSPPVVWKNHYCPSPLPNQLVGETSWKGDPRTWTEESRTWRKDLRTWTEESRTWAEELGTWTHHTGKYPPQTCCGCPTWTSGTVQQ